MKKYSKETVVGIFVVIGLICIAYMAVNLGNVGFVGDNTYSLYGKFNTVTGLRVGNPVNMLGLEIGRVVVGHFVRDFCGCRLDVDGDHARHLEFVFVRQAQLRATSSAAESTCRMSSARYCASWISRSAPLTNRAWASS